MSDRLLTRWTRCGLRLVTAVIAVCLMLSSTVAAQTTPTPDGSAVANPRAALITRTATEPSRSIPVLPKPRKVPHTTRRESRAVVRCLQRAHLKPVVTSGVGFLWEGWLAKSGSFVYAQYYPTLKAATREANLIRLEESGLVQRIVISQHVTPYAGSPVPGIVRCLHGRMITKQPKKQPGHFHF